MKYQQYDIPLPLSNYIDRIFHYKNFIPDHSIERVVPTGNIFLLIELDGFERSTYDDDLNPDGFFRNSWVSGIQKAHINISAHRDSEMMVIQFKPDGAMPFFHRPVHELTDSIRSTDYYFGSSIHLLREAILKKSEVNGKFQLVERWLSDIIDQQYSTPQEISQMIDLLTNAPFSRHHDLINTYPKTQKNLINQFKKYCGISPKVLHRIFRFNALLNIIHEKEKIVWTDIVYETGYTDQSHFIKEFQRFSGFNPSKYIENNYNDSLPNFFPLDREG